jgi:hypothetical protein
VIEDKAEKKDRESFSITLTRNLVNGGTSLRIRNICLTFDKDFTPFVLPLYPCTTSKPFIPYHPEGKNKTNHGSPSSGEGKQDNGNRLRANRQK